MVALNRCGRIYYRFLTRLGEVKKTFIMSLTAPPSAQRLQRAFVQTDVGGTADLQQQLLAHAGEDLLDSEVFLGAGLEEAAPNVSGPVPCFDWVDFLKWRQVLLVADHCDDCG